MYLADKITALITVKNREVNIKHCVNSILQSNSVPSVILVDFGSKKTNKYLYKRFVECVGIGRLHITYYIPGIEKQFENHKHLVWFHNINEGVDQIKYYLDHNKEREKIAKTGRDFLLKDYSWDARAKQFLNILNKL